MEDYFPNLPTSNIREHLVSLTASKFEWVPVGIIYGKKNSKCRLGVWCSCQLHKNLSTDYVGRYGLSSIDEMPPAISVNSIHHYTLNKSSASYGPPAQNTWHVLPHSHSSGRQRTRPSVKCRQTRGSYMYFSRSSNGTVKGRAGTGAFLGAFAKLRKVAVMSVYPSACNNSARNGRTFH